MDKFAKSLFVCVGAVSKYQPFDEDDGSSEVAAGAKEDVAAASPVPYSCEQCGHRGSVAQNKVRSEQATKDLRWRCCSDFFEFRRRQAARVAWLLCCSTRWNLLLGFPG